MYNNKHTKHKRDLLHAYFLLGGVPFCLEYNISNTIYYDLMTPAGRSASHTMYPIWPHHLSPAIYVHASEHVRKIEKPP